jgi:hypothetical protein
MLAEAQSDRLKVYAKGGHHGRPEPGFWSARELSNL